VVVTDGMVAVLAAVVHLATALPLVAKGARMSARKPSRRDLLKAAGIAIGAAADASVHALPAEASARASSADVAEKLANYGSHTSGGRTVTMTSVTGQHLRFTAYGNYIVRVRATRSGETFFADDRYEMVDPANHAGMGGTLSLVDAGASFTLTTGAADGIKIVVQKNPLLVEFYSRSTNALLAKEDATHSMSWSGPNNSVITETFVPAGSDERFIKAGHGLFGRAPKVDRTGDVVSHNYPLRTAAADQAPAIVPLYFSSKGYAVFFNTTFDTTFNFGNAGTYEFSADDHNTSGVRPQLDYFVIQGPQFAKLLDRYTQLTGRPRFPQIGIFGLQLSDKNYPTVSDQNWWVAKISTLRNAGFPFDVQVNDNRWRAGTGALYGSWFEFSSVRWPDPAAFKEWADANGVLTALDYNRNNSNEMAGWVPGAPPGYSFQPADLVNVSQSDAVRTGATRRPANGCGTSSGRRRSIPTWVSRVTPYGWTSRMKWVLSPTTHSPPTASVGRNCAMPTSSTTRKAWARRAGTRTPAATSATPSDRGPSPAARPPASSGTATSGPVTSARTTQRCSSRSAAC
jgi:hypothetical protein